MSDGARALRGLHHGMEDMAYEIEEVNLLDVLILLARKKEFILLFASGIALLAGLIVLVLPSRYTTETVVLPPAQTSSSASSFLGQLSSSSPVAALAGSGLGIKSPGEMYVSLFRSRSVEDGMVIRFQLMARYHVRRMSDARSAFESASSVKLGSKDGLIRISVTDRNPNFAAEMANGYVEQLQRLSSNLAITEASQRRSFFEAQLRQVNGDLANAEEAMKHMQQSTGVLQIDSQTRTLIESASAMRAQIAAKEVEIRAMRSYATSENPQLVIAEEQLTGLKTQLAKLSEGDSKADSDVIVPKGNVPEAELEYLRKLRTLKYYETINELIARQFEMAKLDEAREGTTVQIVDKAIPPDKRSFPKRMLTVFLAGTVGLIFACGLSLSEYGIARLAKDHTQRSRLMALKEALKSGLVESRRDRSTAV